MQRYLPEVRWLCLEMFDGINPYAPIDGNGGRHEKAPFGRKTLLSPADVTKLSEHIMRVTDVMCLSAVTVRGLVLEWPDAVDVSPSQTLGHVALAWHAAELQEARHEHQGSPQPCDAGRHRASTVPEIVLAQNKHAVSADRVINIDEDVVPSIAGADDRMEPSRRQKRPRHT